MKNKSLRYIPYLFIFLISLLLWDKWQIANKPIYEEKIVNILNKEGKIANKKDLILVETNLYKIYINKVNGSIEKVDLLKYPYSDNNKTPLAILHTNNPGKFIFQTLWNDNNSKIHIPQNIRFLSKSNFFEMKNNENEIRIPLKWKGENGILLEKTFVFKRDKYEFSIEQSITNNSNNKWEGFPYEQLIYGEEISNGGIGHISTFTGGVISTPENRYQKISLNNFSKNLEVKTKSGWIAIIKHYFLGAIIPPQDSKSIFYTRYYKNNHILGIVGDYSTLSPGEKLNFKIKSYIGPKIQSRLKEVAPSLDKTVDYGWLFMVAQPMFYILSFIHKVIGNWGWSIIIMTLLIKLVFFTPSAWAYKSMAKMRHLQPQMERLREHFGDDRQALSQAIMQLYRDEKVNPASGCLPMLFQIPFFIAFYYVLIESVELRQAPWILWIHDLSAKDPYFILPIINAALMFLQQKLNPTPPDPVQAKVMMFLPLIFGFMFMWFPSGLVLYWSVSNAFSIAQQHIMNKKYGNYKVKQ